MNEHKVFVYGTLISGERNAHWAGDAKRVNATARGTLYDTGWGFPALDPSGDTVITGQMLTVDDAGLARMDVLEGYPRMYCRKEITVTTLNGNKHRALVYVMNALPESARIIESGDWVQYRKYPPIRKMKKML